MMVQRKAACAAAAAVKGELMFMCAENMVQSKSPPAISEAEACFHQSIKVV